MDKLQTTDARSAIAQRRTHSLTDIVRRELERMILSGELKAGTRINEQVLAVQLGVSRGPIREACRALEHAGLVTAVINQGTFVRTVDEKEANEIYDLRALLFGFACEHLAGSLTKEQKSEFNELISGMNDAVEAEDAETYYNLNLRFHRAVMTHCGHTRAMQSYEALAKELNLVRRRTLISSARMKESNVEHRKLLRAIEKGDRTTARELGEAHVQGGKRRWAEMRQQSAN